MGSLSDARTPSAPLRTPVSLLRAGGGGDRSEAACPPDCRPAPAEDGNADPSTLVLSRLLARGSCVILLKHGPLHPELPAAATMLVAEHGRVAHSPAG